MYRLFLILGVFAFLASMGCKEDDDISEIMEEERVICSSQDSFYLTGLLNEKIWSSKTACLESTEHF